MSARAEYLDRLANRIVEGESICSSSCSDGDDSDCSDDSDDKLSTKLGPLDYRPNATAPSYEGRRSRLPSLPRTNNDKIGQVVNDTALTIFKAGVPLAEKSVALARPKPLIMATNPRANNRHNRDSNASSRALVASPATPGTSLIVNATRRMTSSPTSIRRRAENIRRRNAPDENNGVIGTETNITPRRKGANSYLTRSISCHDAQRRGSVGARTDRTDSCSKTNTRVDGMALSVSALSAGSMGRAHETDANKRPLSELRQRRDRKSLEVITDYPGANARSGIKGSQIVAVKQKTYLNDNACNVNKDKCNEDVENNSYYIQEDASTLVTEATTLQSFSSSLSNDSETTKRTSNSRELLRLKRLSASELMNHTKDTARGAAENDTSVVADNNVTRRHRIPYSRSNGAQTSKQSSSVELDRLKRLSVGGGKPNGDTSGGAKSESVKSEGATNKGIVTRRNTRDELDRLRRRSIGGLEPQNDTAGTLTYKSRRSNAAAITGSETRRNSSGELDRLKRLSIRGLKSESDTAGNDPKYSARSNVAVNKNNETRRNMSFTGGGTTNSRGGDNGLTRKAYLESLSKKKISLANDDDTSASSTVNNATSSSSISQARLIDSEPLHSHNNTHYSRRHEFGSSTGGGAKASSSRRDKSGLTKKAYLESLSKKKISHENDDDASASSTVETNATSLPSISHAQIIDSEPSSPDNNSCHSRRHGFGTSLSRRESSCHEQKQTLINDCNPNMVNHLSGVTSVVGEGYEVSIFPNKSGEISEHSEDLAFDGPAELDRSSIEVGLSYKKEWEKKSLDVCRKEKRNGFLDGPIRSVNIEKGARVSRSASLGRIENRVGDSRQAGTDRRFVDTVVMEKVADRTAKVNISKHKTERCDRSKIRAAKKDATIQTQNVSTSNHKQIAEKVDTIRSIRADGMEKKGQEAPDKSRKTRKIGNIVIEDCGDKSFLSLSPVSRRAVIRGRAKSRYRPSTTSSDIVGAKSATSTSGVAPSCQSERKSSGVDQTLPSRSVGKNAAVAAIKSEKSETEDMEMSRSSKVSSMRALYRPLSLPISRVSATGINSTNTSDEDARGVLPRARWKTVRSTISDASPTDEKAKRFTSTPTSPTLAQFQRENDRLRNATPPSSEASTGDRKEAIMAARTRESHGKRLFKGCAAGVESRMKETMEPADNDNESCGVAVMLSRARQRRIWSGERIQASPNRSISSSKRVDAQSSPPTRPTTSPVPPSKRSSPLSKRVVDESSSSKKFSGISLEIPPRIGASKSSKEATGPSQTIPPRNESVKRRFTRVRHSSAPRAFLETPPRKDVALVKVKAAPRAMVATSEANASTHTVISLLNKNGPKHRRSISLPPSPTSKYWKALVARSRVDFDILKPSRLVSFSIAVLCKAVLPVQRLARQYLSKVAVIKRKRNIVLVQSLIRRWVSIRYFKSAQVIAFRCQWAYKGKIVRDEIMFQHYCAARIQSALRGYFGHVAFMEAVGGTILLQSIWRMHRVRKMHIAWKRRTQMEMKVTLVQSIVRRWIAMKSYMQKRRHIAMKSYMQKRRHMAALIIQKNFRRHMAMLDFSYLVSDIVLCQAAVRRFLALRKTDELRCARYGWWE